MAVQLGRAPSTQTDEKWQILVVDDEQGCADLFAEMLTKEGHCVRAAYSGKQALERLRELPADLMLTDMVMPGMDGMQLLAQVRELYPETDVVVLTGYGNIGDAVEAMRRGAVDFLPKPFRPADLKRLTRTCLRSKKIDRSKMLLAKSSSMLELARLLTSTADLHAFPVMALDLACRNFEADAAILFGWDATQGTLSVLAHNGVPYRRWGETDHIATEALDAIRSRSVRLNANDLDGDCRVCVPLMVGDHVTGALCLRRTNGPWFRESCSELLQIYATYLALSLESARLYQTASERVNELDDLMAANRHLARFTDIEETWNHLLTAARHLTGAEMSAVLVVQDVPPVLRTDPSLEETSALYPLIRDKLLAILRGTVAPVPAATRVDGRAGGRLASFLTVPLIEEGERFGMLAATSSNPDAFSAEDARRLAWFAENAATILCHLRKIERASALYHETMELIGVAIDSKLTYGSGHSSQVRMYAGELARAVGLSPEEIYRIEDGALLHDIGKICIPDSLLNKPHRLSAEEFSVLASHTIYGARMFEDSPHLRDLIPIVRHHHEHFDGTGYPDGLRGDEISLDARIVALGDVFDALVSHRIYRPGVSAERAREIIQHSAGTKFDPELVRLFLSLPLEGLIEH